MNSIRFLFASAFLVAPVAVAAQSTVSKPGIKHIMRGSVVKVDEGGIVVCVGKVDGAQAGQVLKVYRSVYRPGPRNAASF